VDQTAGREKKPDIIMHDLDTKFTKEFKARLKERGLRTNALPKASPNLNGRCERFIETIKLECLAKFIIFGKRHLDYLVAEFVEYYNTRRSHMERDHLPPMPSVFATNRREQKTIEARQQKLQPRDLLQREERRMSRSRERVLHRQIRQKLTSGRNEACADVQWIRFFDVPTTVPR
jgi:hypothetical protein